ncbi:hypothetical protein SprV_0702330100 [Sparganum proliferum]
MAPDQKNRTASQLQRINAFDGEVSDFKAQGRALQKRPQLPLHIHRRRHLPAPPSGNKRRPGPPALPSRNHSHCVTKKGTAAVPSIDGSTLLTERSQILKRWTEHSRSALNRPSTICDVATDRLIQVEIIADQDFPSSLPETIHVVQQLSSRNLLARKPPPDGPTHDAASGDIVLCTSPTGLQGLQLSSICTSANRTARSVTITEASHYSTSLGRSSPASSLIVSTDACGSSTVATVDVHRVLHATNLTERTQILQRWAEHFRGVLNRPSNISDATIAQLPQVETNVDLDLPPSLQETIRAVQQLSSGKAPGSDAITAEDYKHGGPQLMDHLTALFQEMWRQGEVPQNFKDATIVHLYKRKGNRQVCDNYRGLSWLNIAEKIFARILLNRLNNHLEQGLLPESQCGFRRHRLTTDMIFAARQLQAKC